MIPILYVPPTNAASDAEAELLRQADRKRDNRIIALQCAATNTVNSPNSMDEIVDFAKRFEKYLEHGE